MTDDIKNIKENLGEQYNALVQQIEGMLKNDEFRNMLEQYKSLEKRMSETKEIIKDEMVKYNIKRIISPNGIDDWNLNLYQTVRPKIKNLNLVPDNYLIEKEEDMSFYRVKDGKIFKIELDSAKVKQAIKLGQDVPSGVEVNITNNLRVNMKEKKDV